MITGDQDSYLSSWDNDLQEIESKEADLHRPTAMQWFGIWFMTSGAALIALFIAGVGTLIVTSVIDIGELTAVALAGGMGCTAALIAGYVTFRTLHNGRRPKGQVTHIDWDQLEDKIRPKEPDPFE